MAYWTIPAGTTAASRKSAGYLKGGGLTSRGISTLQGQRRRFLGFSRKIAIPGGGGDLGSCADGKTFAGKGEMVWLFTSFPKLPHLGKSGGSKGRREGEGFEVPVGAPQKK